MSTRDIRAEIDPEGTAKRTRGEMDEAAVEQLRKRLDAAAMRGAKGGEPVTILAGNGDRPMGEVVQKAVSRMHTDVQCFMPGEAQAFVHWLKQRDDDKLDRLPKRRKPGKPTLFLLNGLESYRRAHLEPRDFETWSAGGVNFLALAVLRTSTDTDPAERSYLNEWSRAVSVIWVSDREVNPQ